MGKKNFNNFLIVFFIFHESNVKTFLKQIVSISHNEIFWNFFLHDRMMDVKGYNLYILDTDFLQKN